MNINYTVLGWPVHALLCLNMVSRMYYGVSGYAWGTYRSAKVGQKYQPRALGGVSLQWESGKLTDFDAEYLEDGDLPISQFWICVSHACPLLAR